MNTSVDTTRKPLLLIAAVVVIAIALTVRSWYDRRVGVALTLSEVERRARDHPGDAQAQIDWGNALTGMHRIDEAQTAFKTAAGLDPRDPRPLNWLGVLAVQRKQPLVALRYFHTSLQLNPRDAYIWRYAAQLLLQQHDSNNALHAYEHATELAPNDAVAWREMAMIEHSQGAPARGMEHLQHAAALDPNDPVTQNVLGDAALDDGKLAIAKQAFDRALALRPDNREAMLGAARVTLQLDPSPAGLARAGQQIDAALAARPTARGYLARGQWNLLQRRYPAAIADLKTAVKLDSRLITAHSLLSQSYAALGRPQFARREAAAFAAASHTRHTPATSDPPQAPGG